MFFSALFPGKPPKPADSKIHWPVFLADPFFAKEIERVADEMIDLIQVLLDLKEVKTAVAPELQPVDLSRVLSDCKVTWDLLARRKMIRIQIEGVTASMMIRSNRKWIVNIMNNLVSNAVKYSPEGTKVVVRMERTDSAARICVTDQGPGIFSEEQALLFRQFSRLSNRPTVGESSNGLGLYLVKTIIEKLNGAVGVDSEPGRGSCFWVEFPSGKS